MSHFEVVEKQQRTAINDHSNDKDKNEIKHDTCPDASNVFFGLKK